MHICKERVLYLRYVRVLSFYATKARVSRLSLLWRSRGLVITTAPLLDIRNLAVESIMCRSWSSISC